MLVRRMERREQLGWNVRERQRHHDRAAMGGSRSRNGPRIHGTSPPRAALPRGLRSHHQLQEFRRSDQAVDQRSGLEHEPDVDDHGADPGNPPGDAAAVEKFLRLRRSRCFHVDRRRSRPVGCSVRRDLRRPLLGSRQHRRRGSRNRALLHRWIRRRGRRRERRRRGAQEMEPAAAPRGRQALAGRWAAAATEAAAIPAAPAGRPIPAPPVAAAARSAGPTRECTRISLPPSPSDLLCSPLAAAGARRETDHAWADGGPSAKPA